MESPPVSYLIEKRLVGDDVSNREHAKVLEVQVAKPGVAIVRFVGGTATVHYGFHDAAAACDGMKSDEQYNACIAGVLRNPLGFTVLSYEAHRNK